MTDTLTKKQKIESLKDSMVESKRDDGEEYIHFTEKAPRELKELFLEYFEVQDLAYEIFSHACNIVSEVYADYVENDKETREPADPESEISERVSGSASYYTSDRLGYLTMWNQDEISEVVRSNGVDIDEACAYWYDAQVEQAAILIVKWIND